MSCFLGTYMKPSLQTLIKIHALRDISKSAKEEIKWLNTTTPAPNSECVSPGFLGDYKKLLLEIRYGSIAINDTILTSDFKKLTGNKWLNHLGIIQGSIGLLNDNHSETATIVLNNLLAFIKDNSHLTSETSKFISSHLSLSLAETSRKHFWPVLRNPDYTGHYCM